MSESMRRKSSSRQLLQNLIRVTAQRSQEDAEEVERERRRRARERQRGEGSPSWPEPPQHNDLAHSTQLDRELKPSCCLVLEEDEGFSDWSHRLEHRNEQEVQDDCRVRPSTVQCKPEPGQEKPQKGEEQEACELECSVRSQKTSARPSEKKSSSRMEVRTSYSSTVLMPQDSRLQHAVGQQADRTSYLVAGTMRPRGAACRVDGEVEQEEHKEEEETQTAPRRQWRSPENRQRPRDDREDEKISFKHERREDPHLRQEERSREEEDLHLRQEERPREEEDLHFRQEERPREEEDLHLRQEERPREEVDRHLRQEERFREEEDLHLRQEERRQEVEEEEDGHKMPDKTSVEGSRSETSAVSLCSSSEGEEPLNCYGPMSPTFKKLLIQFYPDEVNSRVSTDGKCKIIERTESLRKSTGSVKKTLPAVPVSKIDKRLEQYTHALEVSSKEGRSCSQAPVDLMSPTEPVSAKKNLFEAGEAWNQNTVSVPPLKDADGLKVGVAGLINQWVRGSDDGSRCVSPSRPAEMKPGGVLNKKNLWESLGDTLSSGREGKESSTGKKYRFLVTGHGKYEKVSVDNDCGEDANCQSDEQFYEDL